MKFTIKGILALTLLVAIGLHSFRRKQRIAEGKRDIEALTTDISRQMFDSAYVGGHTSACENAITAQQLPSPYFVAAKAKHERLFAESSKNRK